MVSTWPRVMILDPRGRSFSDSLTIRVTGPATAPRSVPSTPPKMSMTGWTLKCETVATWAPRLIDARFPRICGGRPAGAVTGVASGGGKGWTRCWGARARGARHGDGFEVGEGLDAVLGRRDGNGVGDAALHVEPVRRLGLGAS